MNANRWVPITLVLSLSLNISTTAALLYYRSAAHSTQKTTHGILKHELGLSEEQWKETERLRQDYHKQKEPLSKQMRASRADLVKRVVEEGADDASLQDLLRQIATLESDMRKITVEHFRQQAKVLDPEQRKKFVALLRKCIERSRSSSRHRSEEPRAPRQPAP